MGFYQPAQIVQDAQKHHVTVKPVDINYSSWDNTLEEKCGKYFALRLGFRQVKGLREEDMKVLIDKRNGVYPDINSLRDAGITEATLERLADADAFRSVGLDRRQALWDITNKHDRPFALFKNQPTDESKEEKVKLPLMSVSEHVVHDYSAVSLSLKAHPVSFIREKLNLLRVLSTKEMNLKPDGENVSVAGLVLVRQRPGTAGGICFMTIEDEFGFANLVIFESLFEKFRKEILQSRLIMVEGKLQREGEVIHVIVKRCHDFSKLLRKLTSNNNEDLPILTLSRADEKTIPPAQNKRTQIRENAQEKVFPEARNFR
jgi:error-prone DNA polymerase